MAEIKREDVSSSNIKSVGWDPEKKRLEVEFVGGGVYQYDGVDKEVWEAFLGSESKGKFFAGNIKGRYDFKRA